MASEYGSNEPTPAVADVAAAGPACECLYVVVRRLARLDT